MQAVKDKKTVKRMSHARKAVSKSSAPSTDIAGLKQANKIVKAIDEAREIHEGRKKGKSFDQFLREI